MQASVEKIWASAQEKLRYMLSADTFNLWFAPLHVNPGTQWAREYPQFVHGGVLRTTAQILLPHVDHHGRWRGVPQRRSHRPDHVGGRLAVRDEMDGRE